MYPISININLYKYMYVISLLVEFHCYFTGCSVDVMTQYYVEKDVVLKL